MKAMPWVYRFAMVTTNNVTQAQIFLQVIPVDMATIASLTDPRSPDLAVLSLWIRDCPWSHPPEVGMRMFGPLPIFRDRRSADAKSNGCFPASQLVKKYVKRAMVSCSSNPILSSAEVNSLLKDTNFLPPYRPAVVAQWPPLPPDSVLSHSGSGYTPAQAVHQTRG